MIEPICAQSNKTLKDVQTFSRGKRMDQTTAEIFGSYDEKEGLAGRNKKIIPIYIYGYGVFSWKVLLESTARTILYLQFDNNFSMQSSTLAVSFGPSCWPQTSEVPLYEKRLQLPAKSHAVLQVLCINL
jgi:hypothetical protein